MFLSVFAGLLLAGVLFLVDQAREGDLGMSPYALTFFFACGVMFTSLLIVPFMMNFPAEGEVLEFRRYLQGTVNSHVMGLLAGIIWIGGLAAYLLSLAAPRGQGVGDAITLAAKQGSPILAAVIGFVVFKEFANSGSRVRMQLTIAFVLLVVALAFTTLAPTT